MTLSRPGWGVLFAGCLALAGATAISAAGWGDPRAPRRRLFAEELPPNPGAVAALDQSIAEAALSDEPAPQAAPPPPATAGTISGRRFLMDPNPMSLNSFVLSFSGGDEAELRFSSAGSADLSTRIGLDGVFRFFPGENGLTWRARGRWEGPSRFVVLLDQIAAYHYYQLACQFSGGTATISVDDLSLTSPSFTMQGHME